jgi:serine/threonine-protein kinase
MAPETIVGGPADVRSDIYSFGVMMYFALTARLPFRDRDPMALLAAHVSRPLRPMSVVSPVLVPVALERVVQRCMAKDPADRYASTRALLESFNASQLHPPEGLAPRVLAPSVLLEPSISASE